jgi:predicted dehydrogenase
MRIAIVGCGFVADFYMQSLAIQRNLELAAVTDIDAKRLKEFSGYHGLSCAKSSLAEVLEDPSIELIVNLTNPDSHYDVSKQCLEAGRHVYSEKPLAMVFDKASELTALANAKGLRVASAPCSILGETAQTIWKAIREDVVGKVRLVYAEIDDGPVHLMPYRKWLSDSGRPWPYKDEFEVGCTLEHAGYYSTWLTAFFGPAKRVTSFAAVIVPDKVHGETLDRISPDYTVANIEFSNGAVARLTCGLMAPRDHSMRIIGDEGVMSIKDCWDYRAPVRVRRMLTLRRKMIMSPWATKLPLVEIKGVEKLTRKANPMHFFRGVAELAEAIQAGRESRLPNDFCLHNNELVLAIHHATASNASYEMKTTFKPELVPMPTLA